MSVAPTSGTRSGDLENEIWGTWEELLLACAVNRHGTRNWNSIAMEVQARSSFSDLLTAQSCRKRYSDLRRRFESVADEFEEAEHAGSCADGGSSAEVPWLEDLRKLRMAELRLEVERSDASIISLDLKLKSLREKERNEANGDRDQKVENNKVGESLGSAPETAVGDRFSGGDSGRSCKESNSTDLKDSRGSHGCKEAMESARSPESGGPASMARPVHEESFNGSSETLSPPDGHKPEAPPPPGVFGEFVARDAVEGAGEKESSDLQSSAVLSRRRKGRRRKKVSGNGNDAAEAEPDSVSDIATKPRRIAVDSLPLASFLEIVRSSKYGSVFVRRLDSQDSARYQGLIRRHVDLHMVRNRLVHRRAKYSSAEFFRDLLLLCTNSIVFYPNGSHESTAAVHLRQIVVKEMDAVLAKPVPSLTDSRPAPSARLTSSKKKLESVVKSSLAKENRSSASLITCRQSSSISTKAGDDADERDRSSDSAQKEKRDRDKQSADPKLKARGRLKISMGRDFRTKKTRAGNSTARISKLSAVSDEIVEETRPKVDKKAAAATASMSVPKKRNAAGFLDRLKGNASSSTDTVRLLNSKKRSWGGSGGNEGEKKRLVKGEGRKEATPSRAKKMGASVESHLPAKRNVGRPPKRMAPTPSPPHAKRTKGEAAPVKRPLQKKRGRK